MPFMLQTECTYHEKPKAPKSASISFACAQLKDVALELAWPTRCAICDAPGALVCDTCRQALRFWDPWLACATCGAPFGFRQCCECNSFTRARRGQTEELLFCSSAVLFSEESGSIIRCYKDAGEQRLASFMVDAMQHALSPEKWNTFDAVTFIPDSYDAYLRRGFDHMEAIARKIARATDLPFLFAFERPQAQDQRKLSQKERWNNIDSAFNLRLSQQALSLPKRILIIDDVMTTGATLRAAAHALEKKGAAHVEGLTFARVV